MLATRTTQFGRYRLANLCDNNCPNYVNILRLYSCNYYDTLGIPKSSTQAEIKAAYYKLSMEFHPDRNQGSESAAKKFREISQAYQTLSNYKLRRLYDKGIVQTAGGARWAEATTYDEPIVEDSPQTRFYKSRFTKSSIPDIDGRIPIYDFDAWSRHHYGMSFDRQKAAREKRDRDDEYKIYHQSTKERHTGLVIILLALILCLTFSSKTNYDIPDTKHKKTNSSDQIS